MGNRPEQSIGLYLMHYQPKALVESDYYPEVGLRLLTCSSSSWPKTGFSANPVKSGCQGQLLATASIGVSPRASWEAQTS